MLAPAYASLVDRMKVTAETGFMVPSLPARDSIFSTDKGSGKSPDEGQYDAKPNPMNNSNPTLQTIPEHDAGSKISNETNDEDYFLPSQGVFVPPDLEGETIFKAVFCGKRCVHVQTTRDVGLWRELCSQLFEWLQV
jgi:hypothetical protein